MATITPHEFTVGQNILVTDKHTSLGIPITWPCYVQSIDGDYYMVRRRDFKSYPFRVGKYYPHMKAE